MSIPTIFRVLSKDGNVVRQFRDSYSLSCWFLGRRVAAYIVVKSDVNGDRLVTLKNFEMNALEADLKKA